MKNKTEFFRAIEKEYELQKAKETCKQLKKCAKSEEVCQESKKSVKVWKLFRNI